MSATSDPLETPTNVDINLPVEASTQEDQEWMNAPLGAYSAELISTRDPWPVVSAIATWGFGLANLAILLYLLLR